MSLINDALKKAQKQRTGESPDFNTMPSIGGEPAARIAKRDKPLGFNSLLLWAGVGAGALIVVLIGGFFLVRWMTTRPETLPVAKPAIAAHTATEHAQPTLASKTEKPFVTPTATPEPPVAAPAPVVETAPVVAVPPEVAKPVVVLKLEPKAVAYIEGLHVSGIRASKTDSKVLMNDRVYREGDIVEHQLGLKLAAIAADALTFEDERGARYTRSF